MLVSVTPPIVFVDVCICSAASPDLYSLDSELTMVLVTSGGPHGA